MEIQAIRLKNFMAFRDTGWIDIRPITLLFGLNSSGKSAIIRALRLLKQSLLSKNSDCPLTFMSELGVNLGSYSNVIHQHQDKLHFTVEFECHLQSEEIDFQIAPNLGIFDLESPFVYTIDFFWNIFRKSVDVWGFSIMQTIQDNSSQKNIFSASKLIEEAFPKNRKRWVTDQKKWWFWSDVFSKNTKREYFPWENIGIAFSNSFLPDLHVPKSISAIAEIEFVSELLQILNKCISSFFSSIQYLGPIRPAPKRVYALDTETYHQLSQFGFAPWLRFLKDDMGENEYSLINKWLEKIDFHQSVFPSKGTSSLPESIYSQIIATSSNGKFAVNLLDSGYGISQVLPIIVYCILAKENSLIIIEEPELHLHPNAQASLTDLLIQIANQKFELFGDKDIQVSKNIRFLVETHSENILLRLRKRIAQKTGKVLDKDVIRNDLYLSNNDLSLNYIENKTQQDAKLQIVDVDEWGEIDLSMGDFREFFNQDLDDLISLKNARYGQI